MGDSYVLHLEKRLDETAAERDRHRERVAELERELWVAKQQNHRLTERAAELAESSNRHLNETYERVADLEEELAEAKQENAQLREHVAEERVFCIDCNAGKLTNYDQVFGYICKLELDVAQLRADSERLEWLERHVIPGVTAIDDSGEEYDFDWGPSLPCSLREAIDSARHREPQAQDGEAKE